MIDPGEIVRRITALEGDIERRRVEVPSSAGGLTRVYNSANQSIANSTNVALTHNTEVWDDYSWHSIVSNTSRVTVTASGIYVLSAMVNWAAGANSRQTSFSHSAYGVFETVHLPSAGGVATTQHLTVVIKMVAGEYVEVVVFQDSGGALNVTVASTFTVTKVTG